VSIHQLPMFGPEDRVPDFGTKTVPLTVYLKDGHMVDPGTEGAECHVIGKADIDGIVVSMTLMDRVPEAVMDSLIGMNSGAKFSIGFVSDDD